MRTNRKDLSLQRQILDEKLKEWVKLKDKKPPLSGWIKAIRSGLGITNKQLGRLLSVDPSVIPRLEKREVEGTVTLQVMNRVAHAMGCKLVYAIIPEHSDESLASIIHEQAKKLAEHMVANAEHTMHLEAQGSKLHEAEFQRLAKELADRTDSRIWDIKDIDLRKK